MQSHFQWSTAKCGEWLLYRIANTEHSITARSPTRQHCSGGSIHKQVTHAVSEIMSEFIIK